MYNSAQVIIDLEEYNDLKKKAESFEKGSDTRKEDILAIMVSELLHAISNAVLGMKPDYTSIVLDIAKKGGFDINTNKGKIHLTEIK